MFFVLPIVAKEQEAIILQTVNFVVIKKPFLLKFILPNTLIHIAVQAPLSRAIFQKTEIPWILTGLLIPDIPWIFQRIFLDLGLADPYQVRLYFTAQASLLFSLLLCMCFCTFSRQPAKTFTLLAFNCLLHLLLDALQIKWGNGVHLFAPFSWQYTSFGLLWPEHTVGYLLSLAGVLYLFWKIPKIHGEGLHLHASPRWPIPIVFSLLYMLLPLLFIQQLEISNPGYTATLKDINQRAGKTIVLDRGYYSAKERSLTLFTGESVTVSGNLPETSGTISLKGTFLSNTKIFADTYHRHTDYRDFASIVGIGMTALIWLYLLFIQLYPKLRTRMNQ